MASRTVLQFITGVYVSQKCSPSTCLPPREQKRALCLSTVQSGARFHRKLQMEGRSLVVVGTEERVLSLTVLV
jgi:hypothetical protein